MSSLWTQFLETWVHAASIALPLARVALSFFINPTRCSQRVVGEEAIEVIDTCVAYFEGCEPYCSRLVSVFVCLCVYVEACLP